MMYQNSKNLGLFLLWSSAAVLGACASSEPQVQNGGVEIIAESKSHTSSALVRGSNGGNGSSISDADAQPLIRVPPMFPLTANKSGHCIVRFNVSERGIPYDVKTVSCSDKVFARNTVKSVEAWKYAVMIIDGQAVGRRNVEAKITFRLDDENGNMIPE